MTFTNRNINNNCIISDRSFVDDLYPFSVINSPLSIEYRTPSTDTVAITSKLNILNTIASDALIDRDYVWNPIFINNDNFVTLKPVTSHGSFYNRQIGIENFFSFPARCQHWVGGTLSVDWILNNHNFYSTARYGIMGWIRAKSNSSYLLGNVASSLENFPVGSRLSFSNNNKLYIKINNNTIRSVEDNTNIDISTLGNNPTFTISSSYKKYHIVHPPKVETLSTNDLNLGGVPADLWIADGDSFSYSSDNELQYNNSNRLAMKNFISSPLHKYYTSIYRILTLDIPRSSSYNLSLLRKYKKLAHYLSTSPFINDIAIQALDQPIIKNIIQSYIETNINFNNDLDSIKTVLLNISRSFQNLASNNTLSLDLEQSFLTQNNNLITNQAQLFNKLIHKYSASILINSRTAIAYRHSSNNPSFNSDGIAISQAYQTFCNKSLTRSNIMNSQIINFDQSKVETQLTPTNNELLVRYRDNNQLSIPLVDFASPKVAQGSYVDIMLYNTGDQELVSYDSANTITSVQPVGLNSLLNNTFVYKALVTGEEPNTNFNQPHCPILSDRTKGMKIRVVELIPEIKTILDNLTGFRVNPYLEQLFSVSWRQLKGPPGKFDTEQGISGPIIGNKFVTGFTGHYIFECVVSSPFGTYIKSKSIYIVDGRKQIKTTVRGMVSFRNNPNYRKYWDQDSQTWMSPPIFLPSLENNRIPINTDQNISLVNKLNKIAISNIGGAFWPISSDFEVKETLGRESLAVLREEIYKLATDYRFKIDNTNYSRVNNPVLSIIFDPGNTTIKLNTIILEKIRSTDTETANCLSLYIPNMRSRKARRTIDAGNPSEFPPESLVADDIVRMNKAPMSFTLHRYIYDPITQTLQGNRGRGSFASYDYPTISTDHIPSTPSYGGYTTALSNLGVSIPHHPATRMPAITGFKMDYQADSNPESYKACYQKLLPNNETAITFSKGLLHPGSGWIINNPTNRSSVLKFNPGARDTFAFVGPKIQQIESNTVDSNLNISPVILSSSITLGIGKGVQWDPFCSCEGGNGGDSHYNQNQLHKEYSDIKNLVPAGLSNHGWRILGGGQSQNYEIVSDRNVSLVNDEFLTDQDSDNFSYNFTVTGPVNLPENINQEGKRVLRNPRVKDFGISDIEVKLNFLNYVNTKNLIVWLEIEYCGAETSSRWSQPTTNIPWPSPIMAASKFVDQGYDTKIIYGNRWRNNHSSIRQLNNSDLERYLTNITKLHSTIDPELPKNLKVILLNQEHIQNNSPNFVITFSDNAPKTNVLSDVNINNSLDFIGAKQNIINSNTSINPTLSSNGYSDRESCYYSNIIKQNKLNITNNTLSKLLSGSLFHESAPERGPCPPENTSKQTGPAMIGRTKFTLKMMSLDEADSLNLEDNGFVNNFMSGLTKADNVIGSNITTTNSLCNWELILHVGPTKKYVPHTIPSMHSYGNIDPLSLIEYGKEPSYPGYNFIADLKSFKHLLPIANLNAPYTAIADHSLCLSFPNDPVGQGVLINSPPFPHWAILSILAGSAGYAGATGGTILGAVAGLPGLINNPGYTALINWLGSLPLVANAENVGRQIYLPKYEKYPFGSAEKILLNIRKDSSSLFYSLEASIFRYHNTPILKNTEYNFVAIKSGGGPISEFKYELVTNYTDLIDKSFIKPITRQQFNNLSSLIWNKSALVDRTQPDVPLWQNGDIVELEAENNNQGTEQNSTQQQLYVIHKEYSNIENISIEPTIGITLISQNNRTAINKANEFLKYNIIVYPGRDNLHLFNNIDQNIDENKVIFIQDRKIYDLLKIQDTIQLLVSNENNTNTYVDRTIITKGLIVKNNKYYSVLVLNAAANMTSVFAPHPNCNIYLVYNNQSTINHKSIVPYNIWGTDNKKSIFNVSPEIFPTTHSLGSYGDISSFMNKNLLTYNITQNKLESISDIFNNKTNDKIKYNRVTFYDQNKQIIPHSHSDCIGFVYSDNETPIIFETPKKNSSVYIKPYENIANNSDGIQETIDIIESIPPKSVTTRTNQEQQYAYIRLNSNITLSQYHGTLTIENDYQEYIPIRPLNPNELALLTNKINAIDKLTADQSLSAAIGDPNKTNIVIQAGQLKYLYEHLKVLPDDDVLCETRNITNCPKKLTRRAIEETIKERANILELLDIQTKQIATISYTNNQGATVTANGLILQENHDTITVLGTAPIGKQSIVSLGRSFVLNDHINSTILPKIAPVISNRNNRIHITYEPINTDHYWINIDPDQGCLLDFESNPKVLIQTTYGCIPGNLFTANPRQELINHNVCPSIVFGGPGFSDTTLLGEENITYGRASEANTGFSTYKYSRLSGAVEAEKAQLSAQFGISKWKKFTKTRYFNVNADKMIQGTWNTAGPVDLIEETTIRAVEEYWVPDISYTGTDNDGVALSGLPACEQGNNNGSPGGIGLIYADGAGGGSDSGLRISIPTKVKNLINLDNQNTIQVKIKRIPRMVRGADLLASIYRYGPKTLYKQKTLFQPRIPFDLDMIRMSGDINNGLYCWTCFEKNPNNLIIGTRTPPFFQWQNEMYFRALFGSLSKPENKTEILYSQFPWEMIPYEYGTRS